jgi:mRNA interferase RelE/StbE
MNLKIIPQAKKQIRKFPKTLQIIVGNRIRGLGVGDFNNSKKLATYKDVYRVRTGNYRIVYILRTNVIYIILVAHQRDVYKKLELFYRHFKD